MAVTCPQTCLNIIYCCGQKSLLYITKALNTYASTSDRDCTIEELAKNWRRASVYNVYGATFPITKFNDTPNFDEGSSRRFALSVLRS